MLLCNSCHKISDNDCECHIIDKYIICKNCYNYYNKKLIPVIFDIYDNVYPLYHIHTDTNFIEHAELLIHFRKKTTI